MSNTPTMRTIMTLCEATKQRPQWTYELELRKTKQRYGSGFTMVYACVAHCHSNVGVDVDILIHMTSGILGWEPAEASKAVIKTLQKKYGGTGLMQPISQAIHEALGTFLSEQRPQYVAIQGLDTLRRNLYQSWSTWTFPEYGVKKLSDGIAFVRKGRGLPRNLKVLPEG